MAQLLELAALASYPELEELGRISRRERLEGLFATYDQPDRRWYVAEDEAGNPLGGLWVNPGMHPILEHPEAVVVAVAVLPHARQQGVARALLAHARSEFAQEGVSNWRLFVHPDNMAARKLYEGLGYRISTLELTLK
ncbi:MAG TPA: GNAT family N-acetyltransferase [Stenomitos sp.]